MELDNQENLFSLKKIKMLVGMAFILFITLAGFEIVPVDMVYTIPPLVILYIVFLIFWKKREYSYVKFSEEGNSLVFRYFKTTGFIGKTVGKMIKIPKNQFYKFEVIEDSNSEKLVLHQKIKSGIHVYPYISISAFTQTQIQDLKKTLSRYAQK